MSPPPVRGFDWPGIGIARRIFGRGARPWRFGRDDYRDGAERLRAEDRLGLSCRAEANHGLAQAFAIFAVMCGR
jgi:Protein of unknown function C-terminus (DUF2399)